jgi:antibiotic biosynthesis monooxygenase (ABM) superfamily enzyme
MTRINENSGICTLINVFTVKPENCDKLFGLLTDATEKVMSTMPGYISANIHISDDRQTITNYAQWLSLEDFHNMLQDDEAKTHMEHAAALSIEFRPVTYNKIWTHSNRIVHI